MVLEPSNRTYAAVEVAGAENPGRTGSTRNSSLVCDDDELHTPLVISPSRRNQQRKCSVDNYSDSLFLHNNGMASMLLVNAPLIGPNYSSWSRAMKMELCVRNK